MQTNTKHQVYAGFFVRLAAFLVDMIIVNAGLMVIRLPMWILSLNSPDNILVRDFIFQYSIVDIVIYLVTAVYFVLMTYYTGATLGKKLFQIKVVSTEDRKMTFFEVVYRETIGRFLSSIIMHLGYLLILVEKEHRGVHDLLSDTCVIYYHEKKVYVHTQMNYRNMAPQPGYTVPPSPTGNHQENPANSELVDQNVIHEDSTLSGQSAAQDDAGSHDWTASQSTSSSKPEMTADNMTSSASMPSDYFSEPSEQKTETKETSQSDSI